MRQFVSNILKDRSPEERWKIIAALIFWDFLGIRAIASRIFEPWKYKSYLRAKNPNTGEWDKPLPPPTFFIWFLGIYVALFGIASQRYENRIDIIENRISSVVDQLGSPESRGKALERIPAIQQMSCPTKPDLFDPISIALAFGNMSRYEEGVEQTKEIVEIWKENLDSLNLDGIDLSGCQNLYEANFHRTNLSSADLSNVILRGANLNGVILRKANVSASNLRDANLNSADIRDADLSGINLKDSDLRDANLCSADLSNANLWSANIENSILWYTNLSGAYLGGADLKTGGANLSRTQLWCANLSGAYLGGADLCYADLRHTHLEKVFLSGANIECTLLGKADLIGADLRGVINATVEQLGQAGTLYQAKLDSALLIPLQANNPELFIHPLSIEAKNE